MYFIIEIFIRQNVDTSNVNTKKDFDIFAGATDNGSPLAEKLATFCGIILCPLTLLAKLIKKLIRAIYK